MPLTDTAIKKLKAGDAPAKHFDSDGLFLLVAPSGGKWWRLKYRFEGKEKLLSLGTYPETPLSGARQKRDEARRLVADGIDPSAQRKAAKSTQGDANSFEAIAREWHATHAPKWTTKHAERILTRLQRDVFPWIGKRPAARVGAPDLLLTIRRIEARGAIETAHKALRDSGRYSATPLQPAAGSATLQPIWSYSGSRRFRIRASKSRSYGCSRSAFARQRRISSGRNASAWRRNAGRRRRCTGMRRRRRETGDSRYRFSRSAPELTRSAAVPMASNPLVMRNTRRTDSSTSPKGDRCNPWWRPRGSRPRLCPYKG